MKIKNYLIDKYLDYLNNYLTNHLTIAVFAEHNEIDENTARNVIELGKELHEKEFERLATIG